MKKSDKKYIFGYLFSLEIATILYVQLLDYHPASKASREGVNLISYLYYFFKLPRLAPFTGGMKFATQITSLLDLILFKACNDELTHESITLHNHNLFQM